MTRKNKLIHASASRLGPEKLVLSWVRTTLNRRMKMVKFLSVKPKTTQNIFPRDLETNRSTKSEKRNKAKRSFLREKLNRKLTRMEKIWGIQNLCVYV